MAGCQKSEPPQPPPLQIDSARSHAAKKEATVIIPATVKGKWKAVKIDIIDKANAKEAIYSVPVGGKLAVPGTSMVIEVETFLPAFVMEGTAITSASNELTNPGAKVRISDKGGIIFNGWLFGKYPTAHAFMHPIYGFTLVDAVPHK